MSSRLAVVGVIVGVTAGCYSNPARGTRASGAPLKVRIESRPRPYVAQEHAGYVGNLELTRTTVRSSRITELHYFQGDEEIDEQDYFRLAGDTASMNKVKDLRSEITFKRTMSYTLIGVSIALLPTIFIVPSDYRKPVASAAVVSISVSAIVSAFFLPRARSLAGAQHFIGEGAGVKVADIVERCVGDSISGPIDPSACTAERGGRGPSLAEEVKQLPKELTQLSTPTPSEPKIPGMRVTAYDGRWSGDANKASKLGARKSKQRAPIEIEIEKRGNDFVLVLDPAAAQPCRFAGRVDKGSIVLVTGESCVQRQGTAELTLRVTSGTLSLRDERLSLSIALETIVKDDRRPARNGILTISAELTK